MTSDETAARGATQSGGDRTGATVTIACDPGALNDPDESLDAALVGFNILGEPAAADVDETWLASPRWRDALHALRAHRRRGGRLGDMLVAGEVLKRDALGVYLPFSTAADAVIAAREAAYPPWTVARARERRMRLELRRIARVLDDFANAELAAFPHVVECARRHLDGVRDELARVLPWTRVGAG